ncbi:hypothetical protein BC834DRAFT_861539 [Gloeopeniophorella convolvens]|nr:hypothetical protein BC834DRAFT_861539 [Gloeopeniophorella convolvens]
MGACCLASVLWTLSHPAPATPRVSQGSVGVPVRHVAAGGRVRWLVIARVPRDDVRKEARCNLLGLPFVFYGRHAW